MAYFDIETTPEEQNTVLEAIKRLEGQTVSVTQIAAEAKMPKGRVRYALLDLEDYERIRRVPTKAFNKHYIRYRYEVL